MQRRGLQKVRIACACVTGNDENRGFDRVKIEGECDISDEKTHVGRKIILAGAASRFEKNALISINFLWR